jgi:short-subunit dehydrogenase
MTQALAETPPEVTELCSRYFDGAVVLVTGGSSGIGEALAHALSDLGAVVVIAARRRAELERVVNSIRSRGGVASYVVTDLTSLERCDRLVQTVVEQHARIDVLINNAGQSAQRPLTESLESFHELQQLMQINFMAPARLIRAALPHMRDARFGHIINILSASAGVPAPGRGAYASSKTALAQLGDTLASETAHQNIHVTNAYLPAVRTAMNTDVDDESLMSPQEAAAYVLNAAARRKQRLAKPLATAGVGLSVVAPKLLSRLLNLAFRLRRRLAPKEESEVRQAETIRAALAPPELARSRAHRGTQ